ncbi:MAG: acetate/propionate family kinase [Leptolyngbya sp.]|nr:acetate/propionate family kinase [Candidatus Melainabacteria bacterium]
MSILVVNAGSSTLKCSLFDEISLSLHDAKPLAVENMEVSGGHSLGFESAFTEIVDKLFQASTHSQDSVKMVAHRIVHGGPELSSITLIRDDVLAKIEAQSDLAPTHNPNAISCIYAARKLFGTTIPQLAMFDTSFHKTIPGVRKFYSVPHRWVEEYGIRKYGFHGINHAYCANRVEEIIGEKIKRIIICHLGSGCSLCAVLDGSSVNTTMGFTPMEGLMMATRCGSIDPGILMYLINNKKLDPKKLDSDLNKHSGLLGVGETADMRVILKKKDAGDGRAELAFNMFVDRLCYHIAAMTASLGGLDALVFTAGIGENSPEVRAAVSHTLSYLGVELDDEVNQKKDVTADATISKVSSKVKVLKIKAREELEIARQCAKFAHSAERSIN